MTATPAALAGVLGGTVLLGAPFLRTASGRRAFATLAGTPGGEPSRLRIRAGYAAFTAAYATVVVAVGSTAPVDDVGGLTFALLVPFAMGVAAGTAWLPFAGLEWRPRRGRTAATLAWAGFLAVVTAAAAGGWLLVS